MSNAEHLIENALINIQEDKPKELFFEDYRNKIMSEESKIDLECVYEMALYVLYSWNKEI